MFPILEKYTYIYIISQVIGDEYFNIRLQQHTITLKQPVHSA